MTDNETRDLILRKFYEKRRTGNFTFTAEEFHGQIDSAEYERICEQLAEQGLIDLQSHRQGWVATFGTITAKGIDLVEGVASSPPAIHISNSTNVQVGTGNKQRS